MNRALLSICSLFALFSLLSGCARAPQNKEAIRQAVIEHLSKNSGLDMKSLIVEVTALSFRENEADATVAFRPRTSPQAGMEMKYTLAAEGTHWAVKKRPAVLGDNPHGGEAKQGLPAGHPPVSPGTSK